MKLEDEWEEVMKVWHSIEDDTKHRMAYIWIDKEEGKLQVFEAKVQDFAEKVVHLLKILKDSKGNAAEMEFHQKHFLGLIHHVKPTRNWQLEIQEELDAMAEKFKVAKREASDVIRQRMEARKKAITEPTAKIEISHEKQLSFDFVEGLRSLFNIDQKEFEKTLRYLSETHNLTTADLRVMANSIKQVYQSVYTRENVYKNPGIFFYNITTAAKKLGLEIKFPEIGSSSPLEYIRMPLRDAQRQAYGECALRNFERLKDGGYGITSDTILFVICPEIRTKLKGQAQSERYINAEVVVHG